jgi:hypothetical protein
MSSPRFIVVWDLDCTLGEFSALERRRSDREPVTVWLRPGIHDALARLSAEGFAHVVLTLATPRYAEMALRGTGLDVHFIEVACAGQRRKGDALGIAEAHGMPADEVHDRMIFVGDHPLHDAPSDPRVVFHIEPAALRRHAEPLAMLLLELRRRGEGSLRRGFDALAVDRAAGGPVVRCNLPGIGPVLLAPRENDCPVIVFAEAPTGEEQGTPITIAGTS